MGASTGRDRFAEGNVTRDVSVEVRIIATESRTEFDLMTLALEFGRQLLLRRQVQLVPRREDLGISLRQRVPDHSLAFVRAKHDPDRRVFVGAVNSRW